MARTQRSALTPLYRHLIAAIQQQRIRERITREEMAEEIRSRLPGSGITKYAVKEIELGWRHLRADELIVMCGIMGCTMESLMEGFPAETMDEGNERNE